MDVKNYACYTNDIAGAEHVSVTAYSPAEAAEMYCDILYQGGAKLGVNTIVDVAWNDDNNQVSKETYNVEYSMVPSFFAWVLQQDDR